MSTRFVDEEKLLDAIERAVPTPDRAGLRQKVLRWLRRQPAVPALIGVTGAAKLLDIPKSHVAKLRTAGRFPPGIPVEGAADVYLRSDVEALIPELDKTRRRPRGES